MLVGRAFAAIGCALCVLATYAHADTQTEQGNRQAGQAAFRVGAQAFRANQFSVAAQSFEQAYEQDPRPEIAFSIAQANRLQYYLDRISWRVQRAVQLYQSYLEKLPAGPRAKDAIDRLGELEPILKELRQRGELVPYVAPVRTQLVVGAEVPSAAVTIDGRRAQLWTPVDVVEGTHEVVVDAPGFEQERRKVMVATGRFLPVDFTLRAKPARLMVRAEPGASLYVDGRYLGGVSKRTVPLPAGEHLVSITRRGRAPWNKMITLDRDRELALGVELEPSGQRRAAWWVLGAALTVGAASAGTALWAYSARRDANAIAAARRDLTATPDDLRRYNERVADVRFRTNVTTGLGVGAVAIAVVGAGLWWFDSPRPGEARVSGINVSPIVGPEQVGVLAGARF